MFYKKKLIILEKLTELHSNIISSVKKILFFSSVSKLFRSITSDSALFDQTKTHLMNSKKGRIVDASIAQAYVQQIRNADRFIYIENQYFLGSAYCWLEDRDTNCNHTIPSELTQRIVEKILKRERFCVYVCIPMFPEGNPSSQAGQEVLYWQHK